MEFGKQFVVEFWERPIPQTKDQVITFLASPLIKGVWAETVSGNG